MVYENTCTVKPVYKGHSREPENVAFMVLNATFNNISVISRRSVLSGLGGRLVNVVDSDKSNITDVGQCPDIYLKF